jgi:methyl-accepting chemotaxis protein
MREASSTGDLSLGGDGAISDARDETGELGVSMADRMTEIGEKLEQIAGGDLTADRNLAAKSAEAAQDTEALIGNSIDKAALGVKIAGETNESLAWDGKPLF